MWGNYESNELLYRYIHIAASLQSNGKQQNVPSIYQMLDTHWPNLFATCRHRHNKAYTFHLIGCQWEISSSNSFWLSLKDRTVIIDVSANLPIFFRSFSRYIFPSHTPFLFPFNVHILSFQLLFASVPIVVFDYLHLEIKCVHSQICAFVHHSFQWIA